MDTKKLIIIGGAVAALGAVAYALKNGVNGGNGGEEPEDPRTNIPTITPEEYDALPLWQKYDYNESRYHHPGWKWYQAKYPELYENYIATGTFSINNGTALIIPPENVGAYGWPRWYGYGGTATPAELYSFFYYT